MQIRFNCFRIFAPLAALVQVVAQTPAGVSPGQGSGTVINVRSMGAKGDGVSDDTAAIQAALNAAPPSGGTVFFPRSRAYLLHKTLTVIGKSHLTLQCDPGTTIMAADATFDMLTVDKDSPYFTTFGCTWRGASMDEESRAAMRIFSPNAYVHNSVFTHINAGVCIQDGRAWHGKVTDNTFSAIQGVKSGNGYAVITIGRYTTVSHNHFVNVGRHDVYISGNYAEKGGGASDSTVTDNDSTGNTFVAINLNSYPREQTITGVTIEGNTIRNCVGGINLNQNIEECRIIGNHIENCSGIPIYLNGSVLDKTFPERHIIARNVLVNNATTSGNIVVTNGSGNVVRENVLTGARGRGISITSVGTPTKAPADNVVLSNKISGPVTTPVFERDRSMRTRIEANESSR